jgi:enamine deaminase RidA (YjgF/YER057c/UK114 family)
MSNVVRVRFYVTDISRGQEYIKAYSEWFKEIRPVITMAEVKALARPEHLVEIEVDAVIGSYLTTRLT